LAWYIRTDYLYVVHRLLVWAALGTLHPLQGRFRKRFIDEAVEELARELSPEIDGRALVYTVGSFEKSKSSQRWRRWPIG
jgi:hypothetical protein